MSLPMELDSSIPMMSVFYGDMKEMQMSYPVNHCSFILSNEFLTKELMSLAYPRRKRKVILLTFMTKTLSWLLQLVLGQCWSQKMGGVMYVPFSNVLRGKTIAKPAKENSNLLTQLDNSYKDKAKPKQTKSPTSLFPIGIRKCLDFKRKVNTRRHFRDIKHLILESVSLRIRQIGDNKKWKNSSSH